MPIYTLKDIIGFKMKYKIFIAVSLVISTFISAWNVFPLSSYGKMQEVQDVFKEESSKETVQSLVSTVDHPEKGCRKGPVSYTQEDLDVMSRTIWGEARSEGPEGMEAVAAVIVNRTLDTRWPSSIREVCKQHRQFSCWNQRDPNRLKMLRVTEKDPSFQLAKKVALRILQEKSKDTTCAGLTFYHTKRIRPKWARTHKPVVSIGRHHFYKA